jgi:hypothetical protein
MSATMSVTLSKGAEEKMRRIAEREGRSLAETVGLLAEEALKMREFPHIFFMDGPAGRRARLITGPDVWEVIEPYAVAGNDWDILRKSYDWIDENLLKEAVRYYEAYPEEIDAWLEGNASGVE